MKKGLIIKEYWINEKILFSRVGTSKTDVNISLILSASPLKQKYLYILRRSVWAELIT